MNARVQLVALLVGSALLLQAPLQCSREPEPELRRYETPPEVLYDLALRFRAKGDTKAWRDTLSYLIERYPSSRFAVRARDELGDGGTVAASPHAGG